ARHGGMLTLWVADSGEGIAPAEQGRVFEPFTQGSGRVGSSGLGLALCREILHRHGGRIRLTSTPGQGARFVLRLPA
ncbi:MAG: HAMP domain-containing sensor histidine kinase, partial [Lysobacteraceae bacterium]